jgi:hypothetical protein
MLFRSRTAYIERSPVPRILCSRNGTPQRQTAAMMPESTMACNFAVFLSAAAVKFRVHVVTAWSFGSDFWRSEDSNVETYNIWNSAVIDEQALIPQFEVFVIIVLLGRETFVLKVCIQRYEANFRTWIVSKTLRAERG